MPACFQLYDKNTGEGPLVLQRIDEALCAHFNVPVDPVKWIGEWYGSIGFRLAIGKSYEQIREEFGKYVEEDKQKNENRANFYGDLLQILTYIEEHYTPNSFHSSR